MERFNVVEIITPQVLWGIFAVTSAVFVIMSLVFIHHWGYYGVKEHGGVFAKTMYFVGGIFMLVILASFAYWYQITVQGL